MQKQLDLIEVYPEAAKVLAALSMYGKEPALLEQIESRIGAPIDLESIAFLNEHLYVVQLTDNRYQITNKGWEYLNNSRPPVDTLL
ncbi:MAG: hypothetical protein ABFC56_13355 [Clostridiaceae bacterium]